MGLGAWPGTLSVSTGGISDVTELLVVMESVFFFSSATRPHLGSSFSCVFVPKGIQKMLHVSNVTGQRHYQSRNFAGRGRNVSNKILEKEIILTDIIQSYFSGHLVREDSVATTNSVRTGQLRRSRSGKNSAIFSANTLYHTYAVFFRRKQRISASLKLVMTLPV